MRATRFPLLTALSAAAVLLTACAQSSGGGDTAGYGGPPEPDVSELSVEVDPGDGSPVRSWTLGCGDADGGATVTGDHPDAAAACAHLRDLADPFAPLPSDVVCTEQYGGPQTARVTGTWAGEQVDLDLSRVDGCRISQWDALGPLLPVATGPAAPPT